jgi:hypothetical protein
MTSSCHSTRGRTDRISYGRHHLLPLRLHQQLLVLLQVCTTPDTQQHHPR